MDPKMIEKQELIREILQEDVLSFSLLNFRAEEDYTEGQSRVLAKLKRSDRDEILLIEGGGVGALHAFFMALRERLSDEYPSVEALHFSSIQSKSVPGSDREHPTDAEVAVSLAVRNSYGDELEFTTRSRSMLRASFEVILNAFSYFVNSELAYIRTYNAIEHYKQQNRPELVDKYTSYLGLMVRNTSYEGVIDRLKSTRSS